MKALARLAAYTFATLIIGAFLLVLRPTTSLGTARLASTTEVDLFPPASSATAPHAILSNSRVEEHRFYSGALDREMPYYLYLPPGYENTARRYPVLYMLHGMGGTNHEWLSYGLLDQADAMMRSGEIEPFIIVLPQGDKAYWLNHTNNGPKWGTYVARDLVAEIDARYRTLPQRRQRAIGGVSMGGHGAMQLALNNPKVFGIVGAHSLALRHFDQAPAYFGDRAYFEAHHPAYLCQKKADVARSLTLWLDMGRDDSWYGPAEALHYQLEDAGIPHRWSVKAGGHSGAYWSARLPDYLRYYSNALYVVPVG